MTAMIAEVYDAFAAAGTPDDKARRASEAVAFETRFSGWAAGSTGWRAA